MKLLIKGKGYSAGTIREWNGKKFQKQGDGSWKPVTGEKKAAKEKDKGNNKNKNISEPIEKNTDPTNKPKQPSNDLDEIYKLVAASQGEFTAWTADIAEQFKDNLVQVYARTQLKSKDRAERKITPTEGADSILDIDGKTLVFHSEKDVRAVAKYLAKQPEVVRIKDRFAKPTDVGYRDFLMNIKMSNGAVVELQLTTKALLEAKERGHLFYEVTDQIQAAHDKKDIDSDSFKKIMDVSNQAQRVLYNSAYQDSLSGANFNASAFDMRVALREISAMLQEAGASDKLLSEKTRNSFMASLSKATILSSQSYKTRSGASKVFLVIKSPLLNSSIEPVLEEVNKAKPYPDGTIRTHGGKKVMKKDGGWVPVSEGKTLSEKKDEKKPSKNKNINTIKGSKDMFKALDKVASGKDVFLDDLDGAEKKTFNQLTKAGLVKWEHLAKDEYRAVLTEQGKKAHSVGKAMSHKINRENKKKKPKRTVNVIKDEKDYIKQAYGV